MAQWTANHSGTHPYIVLTISESIDISTNESVLNYSLVLKRPSKVNSTANKSWNVVINGETISGSGSIGGSGDKTLLSGTKRVTHNNDGTKTISVSGYCELKLDWSDGYLASTSITSTSWTLTQIPRYSVIGNIDDTIMGNTININVAQQSSSFSSIIYYKIGTNGTEVELTRQSGGTAITIENWLVPDITTTLTNASSERYYIVCKTYTNADYTGTELESSTSFNAIVPLSVIPNITIDNLIDTITKPSGWGYIVGYSKLRAITTFTGNQGSTKVSTSIQFGNEQALVNADTETTTDTFNQVGVVNTSTFNVVAKAIDSRGRQAAQAVQQITAIPYSIPTLQIEVTRCDAQGNVDALGTSALVRAKWKITDVATDLNTATITVDSISYFIGTNYDSMNEWTLLGQLDNNYDINTAYEITGTIADAFKSNSATSTLHKTQVPVSAFYDETTGEYGVTFNRIALEPGLNSYFDTNTFHKDMQFKEQQNINLLDSSGNVIDTMTTDDLFNDGGISASAVIAHATQTSMASANTWYYPTLVQDYLVGGDFEIATNGDIKCLKKGVVKVVANVLTNFTSSSTPIILTRLAKNRANNFGASVLFAQNWQSQTMQNIFEVEVGDTINFCVQSNQTPSSTTTNRFINASSNISVEYLTQE